MASVKGMVIGAAVLAAGAWIVGSASGASNLNALHQPRDCTAEEQAQLVHQMRARIAPDVAQAVYFRTDETIAAKRCSYRPDSGDYRVEAQFSFDGAINDDHFTAEAAGIAADAQIGLNTFGYTYISENLNSAALAKNIALTLMSNGSERWNASS